MTLAPVSFNSKLLVFRIRCSDSNPKRGFGSKKVFFFLLMFPFESFQLIYKFFFLQLILLDSKY